MKNLTGALGLAVALLGLAAAQAGAQISQDAPLRWTGFDNACTGPSSRCVEVPEVTIFTPRFGNLLKPWKVNWLTDRDDLFWEFGWAEGKSDATEDYLAGVAPIPCGATAGKSPTASGVPEGANVKWPYAVTVFGCKNGQKAECLCFSDPMVIIRDD